MPTNAELEEVRHRFEASRSFEDDDMWIPKVVTHHKPPKSAAPKPSLNANEIPPVFHHSNPYFTATKPALQPNAPQWTFPNLQSVQTYLPVPTGPRRMINVAEAKVAAKSRSSSRSSAYSMQHLSPHNKKPGITQTQTSRKILRDNDKDEVESHGTSEHDAKSLESQGGRIVNGQ